MSCLCTLESIVVYCDVYIYDVLVCYCYLQCSMICRMAGAEKGDNTSLKSAGNNIQ